MPLTPLRRLLVKFLRNVPLRTVLVVQLVLLIVIAVALTGSLSYYSGKQAVRDIVGQMEIEVSDRIEQTLETYLRTPQLVTDINADAARIGLINLEDLPQIQSFFWNTLQDFNTQPCHEITEQSKGEINQACTNLALISLATKTGGYVDFEFNPVTKTVRTSLRDQSQGGKTRTWEVNAWGKTTKLVATSNYNPLERSWYKEAVQAGTLVWSGPFLTAPPDPYPVVSVDRLMTDRQGNILGVTGVAVSLDGFDQFLQRLKIGETGQAFIVDPTGGLIATSTREQVFLKDDQRLKAIGSRTALTRATAEYLEQQFGGFNNIAQPQTSEFWLNGQRQFMRVKPLRDQQLQTSTSRSGLNWLVVTVIPEDDFTAQIKAITRKTAFICLGALLIAIPLGIITSRWITKPILQLSRVADALAQGDWERQVAIQRADELGVLANAFNRMQHELKLSHQQLEEYSWGLEQKNQQLQTLEAELRRQLNLFLHAVSHDLRNPVLGTAMVLNHLSNQTGDEVKLSRKILERMQDSNQHQLELINSLIDTHAAEIWGIALHPQVLALRPLVDSAVADLQPMMEKEKTQLDNRIADDLPLVQVDPLQLGRVYQNLLANALKHNLPGLTVVFDAQPEGKWIYCTVTDDGVGIDPDQCNHLFDPYFRGNSKPKSVGLGLGLYLCQQIIQAHGGKIGVKSQPGQGTMFWFTLPTEKVKDKD